MTWFNIFWTFINIKNHLNFFWNIFMFFNTQMHYICFHKYTPISHFIKWNENFKKYILLRLYFNITCKKIVKFFQKFEGGYTQTCTPLENNTMWHPKGVTIVCFHSLMIRFDWVRTLQSLEHFFVSFEIIILVKIEKQIIHHPSKLEDPFTLGILIKCYVYIHKWKSLSLHD